MFSHHRKSLGPCQGEAIVDQRALNFKGILVPPILKLPHGNEAPRSKANKRANGP